MGERQADELLKYGDKILNLKLTGVQSIVDKVTTFRREKIKARVIEELISLQAAGDLTDEKWLELSQRATAAVTERGAAVDYLSDLERRILRRQAQRWAARYPLLLIEPWDCMVRSIGPGHVGMILAPYKRGKSLMLHWISMAYAVQGLNVLHFTLEDPLSDVEDRLDAAVTQVRIAELGDKSAVVRRRFQRFRRLVRSRLKVYDGTGGGVTVPQIEQVFLFERDRGSRPDALVIDYDDEIAPAVPRKERRFEFADIYRDLRRLAAQHQLLIWTAAQTQRGTAELRVISAERAAEDISKIRKVSLAMSLGRGDWGEESLRLWVAAHKFDKQHVGCNIITDLSRMLIYDRTRTREREIAEAAEAKDE
jgi:hypothetical protein